VIFPPSIIRYVQHRRLSSPPSPTYLQFSWARKPDWSHFYSYSQEIWQYFNEVTEKFELRRFMKLNHQVVGAEWDEGAGAWNVKITNLLTNETFIDQAEVLINGGGVLK
jgi:cation diffusion facilitator CzcD-associated flavoprotein CzcO